jgi:hypothetical protein
MTSKEKINRNIGLTFDFLRQLVDHPQDLGKITDGSIIEFLDKDFPTTQSTHKRLTKNTKYLRVETKIEIT